MDDDTEEKKRKEKKRKEKREQEDIDTNLHEERRPLRHYESRDAARDKRDYSHERERRVATPLERVEEREGGREEVKRDGSDREARSRRQRIQHAPPSSSSSSSCIVAVAAQAVLLLRSCCRRRRRRRHRCV